MKWIILVLMMTGCAPMGSTPSKEQEQTYHASKNFDKDKALFVNRQVGIIEEMWKRNFNLSSLKNIFKFFEQRKYAKPEQPLPEIKPDLKSFLAPNNSFKVIWFGHSTFLINMAGKIILVDPVFSNSAAPVSFVVQRFQPPVLKLEELPKIDYILISHDHYDHLDMQSIQFFKDKKAVFIMPLGVSAHMLGWGISKNRIIEKDWWEEVDLGEIKFIATPAQHFSGRGLFDRNKTLWASWIIQAHGQNIYFSGDSGYDTHFKDIGDKYGPFDVAFLESGQYDKKWPEVHMLPEDGIKAYKDLKAKQYFPVHWGMFVLAYHTWYDPIEQLLKLSRENDVNLMAPQIGQIVDFDQKYQNDFWWKSLIKHEN